MVEKLRPFVGQNHIGYALPAAFIGAAAAIYGGAAQLTSEQLSQCSMVFLMFYFSGTVAGFNYGATGSEAEGRFARNYWRFGKWPYFLAALAGLIHIVIFNAATATLLQLSALCAIIALLPSFWMTVRKTL